VNKTVRTCLLALGLALLAVSVAAAAETFKLAESPAYVA
jgi:hypothetical protein